MRISIRFIKLIVGNVSLLITFILMISFSNAKIVDISKISPINNSNFIHLRIYTPERLYIDSEDNLYVTNYSDKQIHKINSSGVWVTSYGSKGSNLLNSPEGIAVDSQGYVYICNAGYNNIAKFTSEGVFVESIGSYGTGNGQYSYPGGIAIDSNDNIYC